MFPPKFSDNQSQLQIMNQPFAEVTGIMEFRYLLPVFFTCRALIIKQAMIEASGIIFVRFLVVTLVDNLIRSQR